MRNEKSFILTKELLMDAIKGEKEAIIFYQQLQKMTNDKQNIELIKGIIEDEIKHRNEFMNLYFYLFKQYPPNLISKPNPPYSFKDGVKKSILDELDTFELYRNIILYNNNTMIHRIFFDAMTDENEHAAKYNYMYTKLLDEK